MTSHKRKYTHKQIEASGWSEFIKFVLNRDLSVNNLEYAVEEWNHNKTIMKLAGNINAAMYSSIKPKNVKMIGIKKQVSKSRGLK